MRIGIFTDTYPPFVNGVSTSIAMLEAALRKLGHQVYIVTVNPESLSYDFDIEKIENHLRIQGETQEQVLLRTVIRTSCSVGLWLDS